MTILEGKEKMKIEKTAFLSVFIFGIIYGIHYSLKSLIVFSWIYSSDLTTNDVATLVPFLNQVSAVIGWILLLIVLIVMYYIGKKLDLKANLKSIAISMLLGGFIGYFLVRLVSIPIFFMILQHELSLNLAVDYLGGILYTSLGTTSSLFFASFTATATAHLRKAG